MAQGPARIASGSSAWVDITGKPTTLSGYGITDAQGLDADLTAVAGLSTAGLVARTGAGTAATRTITGTANQITVTNGDGVSGNPTLSLPQSIATTSTPQFARLGVGTAASTALLTLEVRGNGRFGTSGITEIENNGLGITQPNGTATSLCLWQVAKGVGHVGFKANDSTLYVVNSYADGTIANGIGIAISTSGNVRFNAYGAGTLVTDSSGNITASSDASLKNVTGDFTRGLADVLKLTPRTYHWNSKSGMDTEDENVGFIAQEVLGAVPEAVGQYRTTEMEIDGKKTKKREKAELLTLSDRPIIAALVNAVKELKAENDTLSDRLSKLEGKK